MIPIKPALSYFRDCYRLDTRTTQLENFFGRKVEQRYMFDGKEHLLNGKMPYLPIPDEIGEKLEGILSLYSKEKVIYYCSFFVVGFGVGINGKKQRICAPLFLNQATIDHNKEGYSIQINPHDRVINVDPLSGIRNTDEDVRSIISREIPAEGFGFGSLGKLQKLLERFYSDLNAEDLLMYPTLTSQGNLKKMYAHKRIKEGMFKVVPAAGLCLIRRSTDTEGIMTELAEMSAEKTRLPDSIKTLFGQKLSGRAFSLKHGRVPALLNEAQQGILKNARDYPLSMVIGPPGTGKSFTIAALAIEFMSRGKAVLIVSKTDQAVDVIEGKVERDLGIENVTIRAGKSDYLKKLKARMTEILGGFGAEGDWASYLLLKKQRRELEERIKKSEVLLKKARRQYERLLKHEMRWGDDLSQESDETFFDTLKTRYIQWLTRIKTPHWSVAEDFMSSAMMNKQLTKEYVELTFELRIRTALLEDRQTLKKLLSAIRARTSSKRESLFSELNFKTMFRAFPIWLCKMSDLHKVLPFQQHLFDTVIIDEATQCDIASCLPAIYRGSQTVIVGDPKQLRHVSFLSDSAQQSLQKKHGLTDVEAALDYRNQSILDLADTAIQSQKQVTFLNEHYRSLPDLIRFSNKHFYADGLKIMSVIPEDHSRNNISHVEVKGVRNKKGFNENEAAEILTDIEALINDEQNLDVNLCRSLGILSPFRDQVDHINDLILKSFSIESIHKHNLLCGTAHSFQGEERDVMFLSFCLDDSSHSTGFHHFNRADVFNVSVTRAKSDLRVYTSFEIMRLKSDSYLRLYLEEAGNAPENGSVVNEVYDSFLEEVREALLPHSFKLKVGYEVADLSLDLAIIEGDKIIGIDLIGYPGVFEEALSLSAYKVLHRAGIRTFPMPYSFWRLDQQPCLEALLSFIYQD
ncbi:MAG: AAA family ATPase [Roseivirga sp.]|nr:AAA family ATPase [Roseivirga sp.]